MTSQKPPALPRGDAALWQRAMEDVTPLDRPKVAQPEPKTRFKPRERAPEVRLDDFSAPKSPDALQEQPLDRSWQKRLRRGRMDADRSVDLHGMTQRQAHDLLLRTLEDALRKQQRIILVITGKGAPKTSDTQSDDRPRGVLRRMVPQWVEGSPYAGNVIAIRPAHPIHGGAGAYYILLRRKRGD
ncbi:MAG: Smr/MutS family protein [Pseudomonadota bacterium]